MRACLARAGVKACFSEFDNFPPRFAIGNSKLVANLKCEQVNARAHRVQGFSLTSHGRSSIASAGLAMLFCAVASLILDGRFQLVDE